MAGQAGVRIEPGTVAVSVDVARQALGISHGTIWRLIGNGELRTRTVGRRRLVPVSALYEFIGEEQPR